MPIYSQFLNGGKGISRIGQGRLTGQELIDSTKSLLRDIADPKQVTHEFLDLAEVTALNITTAQIKQIIELDLSNTKDSVIIIVAIAASDDFVYGVFRTIASFEMPSERIISVFRKAKDARKWLTSKVNKKDPVENILE